MFVSLSHFHPAVNKFCTQKNYSGLYNAASVACLCDTFLSHLVRKAGFAEFKAELVFL
jgi:hypothetical protein